MILPAPAPRISAIVAGAAAACAMLFAPAPAAAQDDWKPETFTLANGMQVVVLPDHRAPVVTHMLWYRVGSADEQKGKSGLAHFLEHLMFKATGKTAAGEYSKTVARNGGQDNASTFLDYTNYHFRIAKDRLPQMMRMEADRIENLQLAEAEVASELKVVQEERRQNVDSNPGAVLQEKVFGSLYAGHPYAVPIIGRMDELAKLDRTDAITWYRTWYGPENAILVVAGDITAAELKPLAEEIYGAVARRGNLNVRTLPPVAPLPKSVEIRHSDPKVRQADWGRYWLGVGMGDADAEALQVGLHVLGGGRTSRLYRELVEGGKAVMTWGYSNEMDGAGALVVSAQPSAGVSVEEIEAAAMAVTDRFLREGPTAEELARAKKIILASSTFSRDSQMSLADWYGSQLVVGVSLDRIEGWEDRIAAVTAADVVRAANKYMTGVHHVDAVLLPGPH